MDINVKLIGSIDPAHGNFSIRLTDANETIGDLKRKIASQLKLRDDTNKIRLIFSGQYLTNEQQRVGELELGPSTFLNVLVVDISEEEVSKEENHQPSSRRSVQPKSIEEDEERRHWRSRFFVYCKNRCGELKPGKLRVRCVRCKSAAVLVKKEPNSWNDILTRNIIRCRCLENRCLSTPSNDDSTTLPFVEFYFKCAQCSNEDGVVALPQVKSIKKKNDGEREILCSICSDGDEHGLMIIFSCDIGHATCLSCFIAYAMEKLERRGFMMHPTFGYTLPCPEPRCRDGYVSDAHHFRLLGDTQLYEKYHRLAAEIYLLGEGGLYCPKVDCGEAFIADLSVNQRGSEVREMENTNLIRKLILCPKCGWAFCFYCRSGASECQCDRFGQRPNVPGSILPIAGRTSSSAAGTSSDEAKSYVTIHWTTKSCPNCRAPTEKNEGCNHMTCVQCAFDWCWDCEKRWTEDCQWNHWFD